MSSRGDGAPLWNNAFLKCVPHQKQNHMPLEENQLKKAESKIFSKLEGMFRK